MQTFSKRQFYTITDITLFLLAYLEISEVFDNRDSGGDSIEDVNLELGSDRKGINSLNKPET